MKSDNVPAWSRTTDLNLAAAISVLGITVGLDKSVDKISGKGWKTLLLGLDSVPYAEIGIKPIEGETDPLPSHKTKTVIGLLRSGKLLEGDPLHPTLDVLRVCAAREALMHWSRTGQSHRLVKAKGVARYQLILGDETETLKASQPGFMTRDLKLAASLCVLGCPIVKLGGQPGSTEFYFAVSGYGTPAPVTSDLAQAFRTKTLAEMEPEHPLLWMMQGLSNRDAIGDMMNRKKNIVMIRDPKTGRASLVSENPTGRTMDRVKKHLRIP